MEVQAALCGDGVTAMFNSLDEQIVTTEGTRPTTGQRLIRFLWIAIVTVLVFGGLYLGVVTLTEYHQSTIAGGGSVFLFQFGPTRSLQ